MESEKMTKANQIVMLQTLQKEMAKMRQKNREEIQTLY